MTSIRFSSGSRATHRLLLLLSSIAFAGLVAACQPATTEPEATATPLALATEPAQDAPAATEPSTLSSIALEYLGPVEFGDPDDDSTCTGLRIDPEGAAELLTCEGDPTQAELGSMALAELQALRVRLDAFRLQTQTEQLLFDGQGSAEASPAWQRALLAWARLRHAELSSGRASASVATAMSWHLASGPDESGACPHLTVLSYGYAYAERRGCETGQLVDNLGDWLTDEEMAQLDSWLYDHAAYQSDQNYISGTGSTPIADPETIEPWATAVYDRLRASGEPLAAGQPDPDAIPATCPTPADGEALLFAPELGLCALIPGSHSVFSPSPGLRVVAKDSLLDASAPRLSISAVPAEDQDAAQAADAILADLEGFDVDRSELELTDPEGNPIPAIVLDGLPGQDLNRLLLFVHAGQRYELRFSPSDHPDIEPFYSLIIESLDLAPQTASE